MHEAAVPVLHAPAEWGAEGPRGARVVLTAMARSPRWKARIGTAKVRNLVLGVVKRTESGKAAWVTEPRQGARRPRT